MITDYEDGHREVLLYLTPMQAQEAMAAKARAFAAGKIAQVVVAPQSRIEQLLIGEMHARARSGVDQPTETLKDVLGEDSRNRKERRKDAALARRSTKRGAR